MFVWDTPGYMGTSVLPCKEHGRECRKIGSEVWPKNGAQWGKRVVAEGACLAVHVGAAIKKDLREHCWADSDIAAPKNIQQKKWQRDAVISGCGENSVVHWGTLVPPRNKREPKSPWEAFYIATLHLSF